MAYLQMSAYSLAVPSGANVLVPAELQLGSIAADAVVDLAAEQLVDGNIEYLALDVHEGNINGADRRKDNRAAALAPEADFEHALPELVRAASGLCR